MSQPGSAAAPEWSRLASEVSLLESRVAEIERLLNLRSPAPAARPTQASPQAPDLSQIEPARLVPLVGRALLGLAGAYLLRALTEGGALHPSLGVGLGLAYAIAWLVWAARTPASQRVHTALHSATSVLVLSPLLWEATLRFGVVSSWTAGAISLFFTVFGMAVSWRKNLLIVATFATLAGMGTAAALLVATRDALPFTFVLLAIAAAVEASACLDHWLSERWLAAAAADLSVLLATWLVTNARGLPQGYAPVPKSGLLAAQGALIAIYLSSIMIRTLLRGSRFTTFETAQCAAVLLIGVGGAVRSSHQGPAIAVLLLACSAACYAISFFRLEHGASRRNFFTYSTFGLLIALAGSLLLFSGAATAALWSIFALGSAWAGGFFGRLTLQLHGAAFLLISLFSSGAFARATAHLLGGERPESGAALWGGAVVAAVFYALVLHYRAPQDSWTAQAFRFISAGMLTWLAAGLAAFALASGCHAIAPQTGHAFCAMLRTGVLALGSLILAWAGSRWDKPELSRLIFPLMALGAYRLLTQDLAQEQKTALFFSLLVYGAALILLPRLSRRRAAGAAHAG